MNHDSRVLEVVQKLAIIGIGHERLKLTKENEKSTQIVIDGYGPYKMTVSVSDYYAYPDIPCFFVNCSNGRGFYASAGTPHIETMLFDLGGAVGFTEQEEE